MSGVALIPNIAKGKFAYYGLLPAANDALVWVLFAASGLESDAVLKDKDSLADTVAGSTNEATFTGAARVTATAVTVTVDDVLDRVDVDAANPVWSPSGTAEVLAKLGLFYDPDTTGGVDADLIPQFFDSFDHTTGPSGTVAYDVAAGGWGRAE